MAEETAPATAATPAAATPAPATPAAAATPAPAPAKPNGKPKPPVKMVEFIDAKGKTIQMPETSFQARLERGMASRIKQRLGVSLEEAEKIVKAGGVATQVAAANPASATPSSAVTTSAADETVRRLQQENQRLKRRADIATRQANDANKKRQREVQRLKDQQMDAEFRIEAIRAGIHDPDYAIVLYSRAAAKGDVPQPSEFFGGLKASHPHLFVAPQPVTVAIPASTAPPESQQPGEAKPTPAAAGAATGGGGGKTADDMSPNEFEAHKKRYGWSGGY